MRAVNVFFWWHCFLLIMWRIERVALSLAKPFNQPAKLSPELLKREGTVGITPDNYHILPPSSNHIL
jgi:hypothetical protein